MKVKIRATEQQSNRAVGLKITALLLALQFLTIIPIKIKKTVSEDEIARSSSLFVLVGFIQGILLIAAEFTTGAIFHHDLVIGLILFILVLSNGGFHLDGLADTFDALAVKSSGNRGADRQKRLSVMKDATTGPIGIIAIVFAISLKYLALKNLSHHSYSAYYLSLLFMPVLSKWTMSISMFHGKPARQDGIGSIFLNRVGLKEIAISTFLLLLLLVLINVLFSSFIRDNQYVFYAVMLIIMYFLCRAGIIFFSKKFGGLTGDTLGAISEITEIIFLLMVITWSQLYI